MRRLIAILMTLALSFAVGATCANAEPRGPQPVIEQDYAHYSTRAAPFSQSSAFEPPTEIELFGRRWPTEQVAGAVGVVAILLTALGLGIYFSKNPRSKPKVDGHAEKHFPAMEVRNLTRGSLVPSQEVELDESERLAFLTLATQLYATKPLRFEDDPATDADQVFELVQQLPSPLPEGTIVTFAYWDVAGQKWLSVPTDLSPDRLQVTARTSHLSDWTFFAAPTGQVPDFAIELPAEEIEENGFWDGLAKITKSVIGVYADAPECAGSAPTWATPPTYQNEKDASVKYCVGGEDGNLLVAESVNSARPYVVRSNTLQKPSLPIDLQTAAELASLDNFVNEVMVSIYYKANPNGALVPPGRSAEWTFFEADAENKDFLEIVSEPADALGTILYLLIYGLAKASPPNEILEKVSTAGGAVSCVSQLREPVFDGGSRQLHNFIGAAATCLDVKEIIPLKSYADIALQIMVVLVEDESSSKFQVLVTKPTSQKPGGPYDPILLNPDEYWRNDDFPYFKPGSTYQYALVEATGDDSPELLLLRDGAEVGPVNVFTIQDGRAVRVPGPLRWGANTAGGWRAGVYGSASADGIWQLDSFSWREPSEFQKFERFGDSLQESGEVVTLWGVSEPADAFPIQWCPVGDYRECPQSYPARKVEDR